MSAKKAPLISRGLQVLGGRPAGISTLILIGLITAMLAVTVTTIGPRGGDLVSNLPLVLAFLLAIVVAEQLRIPLPGRAESAPLGTAVGLAMAFATDRPGAPVTYTVGGCILAVGLAIAVGALPRHLREPRDSMVHALDSAVRLFSVTLAALIWRNPWPCFGSESLMTLSRSWAGWQKALVLVTIGIVVVLGETPIRAAWRAAQEQLRWAQATSDEAIVTRGLTSAVAVTAAMIAICLPVLDLVAVPLMMLPMVFTQNAVRRQSMIRETYRQTVIALSRMPEVVGIIPRGHAKTVAQLSVAVARKLGMKEREVNDLEFAALLHDIGQVTLRYPIPGGATVQAAPIDQQRIADDGAAIIRETGVLGAVSDIVATQVSPYHRVVEGQERLPMSSRILKVTNAYADHYAAHADAGEAAEYCRAAALERIYLGLGYQFDPAVVAALERTVER